MGVSGRFHAAPVRVSVPATSANLGPGYDALGLALDLRDELEARVVSRPVPVEVTGEGADELPRDESHLVLRALRAALERMGFAVPPVALRCRNAIPHSRGLGSSSAAIVAGVALARALVPDGVNHLDDDGALQLAADLEGHPDNVAPALFGGLVACARLGDEEVAARAAPAGQGRWIAARADVDPRIGATAFIPPDRLSTQLARGLLPAEVPHADAAANAARAALLALALTGRPEHLWAATRDLLHQQYRRPAMPASLALLEDLRGEGVPAFVSGAGPTVLAFTVDRGSPAPGPDDLASRCPEGWRARHLAVDPSGVRTA